MPSQLTSLGHQHTVKVVNTRWSRVQESLTTQEAADLLHVSRPYLIGLLDKGLIPYYRLRSHRRIRLEDLLAFREKFDAERHAALDELSRLSQEAGLYDE